MISNEIRERYLKDPLPTRLGGLAADLARVASFSEIHDAAVVEGLLEESQAFIEWCAPSLLPDRMEDAARLVDIQRSLTDWYHRWNQIVNDLVERKKLAVQAQHWSDEVLKMSGLLEQE